METLFCSGLKSKQDDQANHRTFAINDHWYDI